MVGSKKQNILLLTVICCALLALISITWAAFSSTLKLSGQASVAAQSWDIDFTNTVGTKWTTAQTLTGTKTNLAELPTSSSGAFGLPLDQTASGFLGSLRMSGDKITYTWYVQNFGTFEAKYSISGLISTGKYLSGSNVDISCNTSDNSSDKTFCNNYVKTTLTIDGVVADASSSYTLAKAGQTGDSSTLVLTIEIIGDNQIYTATASTYNNVNPSMLLGGIEMLDSSNDLNISVTGLTLSGTQSVAETTPVVVSTTEDICTSKINTEYLFDYTGDEQTFTASCDGTYKLEVWGGKGGDSTNYNSVTYTGGNGGYSTGTVTLNKEDVLYINVGGAGEESCTTTCAGGYNGGGSGTGSIDTSNQVYNVYVGSGGGATHIATSSGLLSSLSSSKDTILIVAGGGGGAIIHRLGDDRDVWTASGGAGGGITSEIGTLRNSGRSNLPTAATQTSPGIGYNVNTQRGTGSFGQGQNGESDTTSVGSGAGAGGGWYGGGSSVYGATSGGSSYIDGVQNGSTISGIDSMPTHDGSSTMTGNLGNGYAKITYLG